MFVLRDVLNLDAINFLQSSYDTCSKQFTPDFNSSYSENEHRELEYPIPMLFRNRL